LLNTHHHTHTHHTTTTTAHSTFAKRETRGGCKNSRVGLDILRKSPKKTLTPRAFLQFEVVFRQTAWNRGGVKTVRWFKLFYVRALRLYGQSKISQMRKVVIRIP